MNKIILSLLLLIAFAACKSNQQQDDDSSLLDASKLVNNPKTAQAGVTTDSTQFPEFTFGNTQHDFGTITEGEMVQYAFKFKNTGKGILLISKVESSCGCTVPEFSKDPVAPGNEGVIRVTFDSKGRPGNFQKTVYVIANTLPNETKLTVLGTVQ